MRLTVAVLPGDGIGPEVTAEAVRVLEAVARHCGHELRTTRLPIGAAAIEATGDPLPAETLQACLNSAAVLLGAVGHPSCDDRPPHQRPERGLLQLRHALGAFANLRPAVLFPALVTASPLRADIVAGTDILIVRELLGGVYAGEPRGIESRNGQRIAFNTMRYAEAEVERIARVAFRFARQRRRQVASVDKANVLECSQLWRETVTRVAREFPDVALEHLFVDACSMALASRPASFDVILTENLFGDILSDEAGAIVGSLGLLPSASVGGRVGLYEPVHGSAPDIAGRGIANPLGAILCVALMLRHTFQLEREAASVERAVSNVLAAGYRTRDLARAGESSVTTAEMGQRVADALAVV